VHDVFLGIGFVFIVGIVPIVKFGGRLVPRAWFGTSFNRAEAVRRLRTQSALPVGEALLNQRLLAGLGNVLKSEGLFSCGINPFVSIATLDDHLLENLVDTGRRLLQVNVGASKSRLTSHSGQRRTTGRDNLNERLWVYGRGRLPCRRCGTPIEVKKHGPDAATRRSWEDARLTYWCPACQTS
jgi:endonuclease VIII